MKSIPLTRGLVALCSDEDYESLAKFKWRAFLAINPKTWYGLRGGGRETVYMHRQILGLKKGDGLEVDHCDHNGLNCQRENLRVTMRSGNQHNKRKQRGTSSHFKGVYWHKASGAWQAYIRPPLKKSIYLGQYEDEVEAARAYDKKARELFGEFAHLNFDTSGKQLACAAT
jgi:hypothetical protein